MAERFSAAHPVLSPAVVIDEIFPGNTEMARRMRELDLVEDGARSASSAGRSRSAPRSAPASIARFPSCSGGDLSSTILYNDEYRPILGPAKHPAALGERGAKVWAEIWDVIGPMLSQVMRARRSHALTRSAAAHRSRLSGGGVLFVFLQPDPRRGRKGRRHLLSGHRNDREGDRRAASAHAARSRRPVQGRRERRGGVRCGGVDPRGQSA